MTFPHYFHLPSTNRQCHLAIILGAKNWVLTLKGSRRSCYLSRVELNASITNTLGQSTSQVKLKTHWKDDFPQEQTLKGSAKSLRKWCVRPLYVGTRRVQTPSQRVCGSLGRVYHFHLTIGPQTHENIQVFTVFTHKNNVYCWKKTWTLMLVGPLMVTSPPQVCAPPVTPVVETLQRPSEP